MGERVEKKNKKWRTMREPKIKSEVNEKWLAME